jgi:uncharacterized protein (DUF1330 family)
MPAYAVAHLRTVEMGPDIVRYLEEIDATLEPYRGRFLVHGGEITEMEGSWPGALVVIEFPSRELATAWYASDAYQAIVALRTRNSDSVAIIAEGVKPGHRATDLIPAAG